MTRSSPRHVALPIILLAIAACNEVTTPTQPDGTVSQLATSSDSWAIRADMPGTTRYQVATAGVENPAGAWTVYVIGGATGRGAGLSTVQAYNVATNTWRYKAPLPNQRLLWASNGAVTIRGKVYVNGGLVGRELVTAALYEYDPAKNTWTRKRDMPRPSYGGVTAQINNKLYVASGCGIDSCGPSIYKVLYRYDPLTDQWTTLATPPGPDEHKGRGGAMGGKLYIRRGNLIDVYTPSTNTWATKTSTGDPGQGSAGAAAMDGKLYLFGSGESNTSRVYDPTTNQWSDVAPMPGGRHVAMSATRVFLGGLPRIQLIGGAAPNNLAYVP